MNTVHPRIQTMQNKTMANVFGTRPCKHTDTEQDWGKHRWAEAGEQDRDCRCQPEFRPVGKAHSLMKAVDRQDEIDESKETG